MQQRTRAAVGLVLALVATAAGGPPLAAGSGSPPRLAVTDGVVSFLRPGGAAWTQARPNTPLATGDALHAGTDTSVEIQIGPGAWLRLASRTLIELSDASAEQLQLKVVAGDVSLDLHDAGALRAVEADTPHAAVLLDRRGYYRLHVDDRGTALIVRRGGAAMATPGQRREVAVRPSEEVVFAADGTIHRFAAPDLDAWDRWNAARTDALGDALSARYVPAGVYGVGDLDSAGTWREVPAYGPVWLPDVPPGWAPYAAGEWIWDPTFGWSWVDDAPWGWAPFHHGRWAWVDGWWAWIPGPEAVVPAYAPATVGWLEGGLGVGWVPVGFGEPLFPWWGARGGAWWGGWGGPWFVNGARVEQRVTVYASNLRYANAAVFGAVSTAHAERFGRGARDYLRALPDDVATMRPTADGPGVEPVAASLAATRERGEAPPKALLSRRVVATRMPPDAGAPLRERGIAVPATAVVQLVLPPQRPAPSLGDRPPATPEEPAVASAAAAPASGDQQRARPAPPPHFAEWWDGSRSAEAAGRRVPRDLFAAPWQDAWEWRGQRGFEPPMGEPARVDLPGTAALRLRPSGGPGGFGGDAAGGGGRPAVRAAQKAAAPAAAVAPAAPAVQPPAPAAIPPPTRAPEVPPPLEGEVAQAVPPPTTAPPPACGAVGERCGPCWPRGKYFSCWALVGEPGTVCAWEDRCDPTACIWDADCGPHRRCVLNPRTYRNNCCQVCPGAAVEGAAAAPRPRAVEPAVPAAVAPAAQVAEVVPARKVDVAQAVPPTPTTSLPPPSSGGTTPPACGAVGERCGPCWPRGKYFSCWALVGEPGTVCAWPDRCEAMPCIWDADCGSHRRCVLNPTTHRNACCQVCPGG
jgi:hypothetical protein